MPQRVTLVWLHMSLPVSGYISLLVPRIFRHLTPALHIGNDISLARKYSPAPSLPSFLALKCDPELVLMMTENPKNSSRKCTSEEAIPSHFDNREGDGHAWTCLRMDKFFAPSQACNFFYDINLRTPLLVYTVRVQLLG